MRVTKLAGTTRILVHPPLRTLAWTAVAWGTAAWLFTVIATVRRPSLWLLLLSTLPLAIILAIPIAYLHRSLRLVVTQKRLVVRPLGGRPVSIPRHDVENVSFVPGTTPGSGRLRVEYMQHHDMSSGGPLATFHERLDVPTTMSIDQARVITDAIAAVPLAPSRTVSVFSEAPNALRFFAAYLMACTVAASIESVPYAGDRVSLIVYQTAALVSMTTIMLIASA